MTHKTSLAALSFLCIPSLSAQDSGSLATADAAYQVRPEVAGNRTVLRIRMDFAGDADGTTRLQLPSGSYGTPEVWNSLRDLQAAGVEVRRVEGKSNLRDLVHESGAAISLSYAMDRSPELDDGVAYRPAISASHFHYFEAQWRCRLPERNWEQSYSLSFEAVPEGWTVFSNRGHGPGPYHFAAKDQDLNAFIAGGDYESELFDVGGKPMAVYVQRTFAEPESIVATAKDILTRQGERFGGFDDEYFVLSLSTREGLQAGVAIDKAFVCLLDAETSKVGVDVLIAHEVFHNWLPRTAAIHEWKYGEFMDHFRLDWLHEGFAEYMARRMLLDAGRIEMDDYVERFNRDLREQARNPQRRTSLTGMRKAAKDALFLNSHERSSYFRGPLIALDWERQLQEAGEYQLADLVQAFIARASAAGGTIKEDEFFALVEDFGIDGRAAYRRHIEYGDEVMPDAQVFGDAYRWEPLEIRLRDAGFDTFSSRRADRVIGVVLDGPAHRAGLRDGMEIVELQTVRSPDEEMRVKVRDGGLERVFEYRPAGPVVGYGRFVPVGKD